MQCVNDFCSVLKSVGFVALKQSPVEGPRMYVCVYVSVCVCMYVCTYVCTHVCVYLLIYTFASSLFNDSVSISHYIASDDRMINY
jgi:hypothetical protein